MILAEDIPIRPAVESPVLAFFNPQLPGPENPRYPGKYLYRTNG